MQRLGTFFDQEAVEQFESQVGDEGAGKFIPPVPSMTQSQFDTAMSRVRDADLSGAFIGYSGTPEPVTAEMMRDELQMVSSGNGTYFLRYPGAGLARDEKGHPFELDVRSLLPVLGARRNPKAGDDKLSPGVDTSDDERALRGFGRSAYLDGLINTPDFRQ